MVGMLFPRLAEPTDDVAVRVGDDALTYAELATASGALAHNLAGTARAAVWATPSLQTVVGVVGCLRAGVPAVPVNPKIGERELGHILGDSRPDVVICAPGTTLPEHAGMPPRVDVPSPAADQTTTPADAPDEAAPALIVYTSGTTGPPKGVVLPHRAIASTLDALAQAWSWTARDVVVHALPLFHVHGLVLGTLGPLRRGGAAHHLGRFSPAALGHALREQTAVRPAVVFGVPTMYHRLGEALESDAALGRAVGAARLLVSGSAGLPVREHERITRLTGQRVIERYGMTETLMNTSVRVDGPARPGTVGPPRSKARPSKTSPSVRTRLTRSTRRIPMPAYTRAAGSAVRDAEQKGR
jgi:malonyl-CoA/methylmalonyl-CoA synthetase